MPEFDLESVQIFMNDIAAEMDRCDNGEGMECATLDDALVHYGDLCCKLAWQIQRWGQEVFAGRVAYDPEVEKLWRERGSRLYSRAWQLRGVGQEAEEPCYTLEGRTHLEVGLGELSRILMRWVSPRKAVGPAARQGIDLDSDSAEVVRRRIDSLPSLPSDWEPADPAQREMYRKLRSSC
jgi:hypothetical protein